MDQKELEFQKERNAKAELLENSNSNLFAANEKLTRLDEQVVFRKNGLTFSNTVYCMYIWLPNPGSREYSDKLHTS